MSQNIFNPDFVEFINALNDCEVDYVLVGGYAVILHGYSRTTGDMDLWINPTRTNYEKLVKAFDVFRLPLFDMTLDKFLNTEEYDVFSFGRPPMAIDIMTKVKGLVFNEAVNGAQWFELEEEFAIRVVNFNDLIKAKTKSGRFKDLDDIEQLKQ